MVDGGLALLVVLVLTSFVPKHPYLPHGMALPAKEARAPTQPSDVHLYQKLPLVYQQMGSISIEMHASGSSRSEADKAAIINKAKQLAATTGANGLVYQIFYSSSNEGSALDGYFFRGMAFYTTVPTDLNLNALFDNNS